MRVVTAADCLRHEPPPGFPERPERLQAILERVALDPSMVLVEAAPAEAALATRVHSPRYLEQLAAMSAAGTGQFAEDAPVVAGTWAAALGAMGAAVTALELALAGGGHTFAAIRPPGHHALHDRGMGFCFIGHAALLATLAREGGHERTLIVDWDVHHGNGTQALVWTEARTRFVSLHQWPWYPGTGAADERGVGNCFNVPMPAGLPRAAYVAGLWQAIEQATAGWTPDLIVISAGYDAMLGDPLGGFTLEAEDYATWVTRLRDRLPDVPIVGLLEGGYNPARLADGVAATVGAMAG
jgi:acetoin utilization deacetylase AcuC-like enzyme